MERINRNLNRDWKFIRGEQSFPGYKGIDDKEWKNISLPHDWSVEEDFDQSYSSGTGYLANGVGWYRKRFTLPEEFRGKRVAVTFEGVYNNSQVWCNSYHINKRPYGYSTFTYDLTDFVHWGEDDNVISVKVDHKDSADSRWFTGSGIYRNVYLTVTDQTAFTTNGIFVTTPLVSREEAKVKIQAEMENHSSQEGQYSLSAALFDKAGTCLVSGENQPETIASGEIREEGIQLSLNAPRLWSVDDPCLYTIKASLMEGDKIIDCVEIPMGFRYFNFDPEEGFSLNGVSMKMKGVCLHHDAGCLGAAVPRSVWKRRLDALKEMGCNAIRCSHNPPSPDFLDLCDELGFLVQDEAFDEWEGVKNKWWQGHNVYPPKHFGYYEDFPEWHKRDLQDMVKRDRNHPSIVFWSIGNEIDYPNDPYCHESFQEMTGNNDKNKPAAERQYDSNKPNAKRLVTISRRLVKLVKECDTTRPVTAALAFPELSNITGLSDTLDIVGYNYKEQWYEDGAKKWPDRVLYGSENGKHLKAWKAVKDNDRICAQFLWTGIDYLGEAKGWPVRVAASGLMDTAGYAKPSYYYRQSLWSNKPMTQLATVRQGEKDGYDSDRFHWNYSEGDVICVRAYSNMPRVELYLNGCSLGEKKPTQENSLFAEWDLPFEKGEIKAVGRDEEGREEISNLVTTEEPSGLKVGLYEPVDESGSVGYAELDITLTDKEGRAVTYCDSLIELEISGPARLMGMENGCIDDLTPYSSTSRQTFQGRLKAYIRRDSSDKPVTVSVKSGTGGEVNLSI